MEGKYIVWNMKYSVGDKELDSQHQQLFETINSLYSAINSDMQHSDIEKMLISLYNYGKTHFKEEEELLYTYDYPDLISHKMTHLIYLRKVRDLMSAYSIKNIDLEHYIFLFLKNWWKDHVLKTDQKYASFLKNNKGKKSGKKKKEHPHQGRRRFHNNSNDKQWQHSNTSRNDQNMKNERYYASILELPIVTKDNLREAYHQKVKEYHPDRVANLGIKIRSVAEQEMEKINEAADFFRKKYGPF